MTLLHMPLKVTVPKPELHPVVQSAIYDVDQAVVIFAQEILTLSHGGDPSDVHRLRRVLERLSLSLAAYADEAGRVEDQLTSPSQCLVAEADFQRYWGGQK